MKKEVTSQKVSLGEKVGYSLGDAAANLVFQMMMIFQLKFYTDVFGLDGALAGSILMIGTYGGYSRRSHEHPLGKVPPLGYLDRHPLLRILYPCLL